MRHAHHWLILHGRYTCIARKPDCPHCAVRDLCAYEDKTPGPGDMLAPAPRAARGIPAGKTAQKKSAAKTRR
jgi:endonuclease-3